MQNSTRQSMFDRVSERFLRSKPKTEQRRRYKIMLMALAYSGELPAINRAL